MNAEQSAQTTAPPHQTPPESEEERQEDYRREYELQLKRIACPGCGESTVQ